MRVKRFISGLLAAALLAGLVTLVPASAADGGAFTDIQDAATANAAETLRVLGVVDGTGGTAFNPGGTLTRAEFCKMAVEILGRGGEEPAQRNRTIFSDVGPSHWARGYVNLAASITVGGSGGAEGAAGTRLIMGVGDGTFRPDRAITYGEAVTMLMRVLGYGDQDVASGANWYDGYVGLAGSSGLADGLSLSGASTLTRGQAAILFYNLLFTNPKDRDSVYLTDLGGSLKDNVIVLSTDATAEDGTTGSVLTTSGTYKTDRAAFGSELCGTRGQIVLDKNQKLLTILPEESSTFRSATIMGSPEANAIPVVGGDRISVTLSTPVYRSDDAQATTYETEWTGLRTGTSLVLAFNGSGKLDYIYLATGKAAAGADNVMVVKNKPSGTSNPFTLITGGKSPALYKNGAPAQVSDIRQYDVGTYDKTSNTLFLSDLKLSGLYEDAYPNTAAPSRVTLMGVTLDVLPSAMADLSAFQVGDKVTLLLTTTGQVAGAVDPATAQSNAVGVAKITSKDSASVELLDGLITVTGKTTMTESAAQMLNGRLVSVSSYKKGYLSLSRVTGAGAPAALNMETGKMGNKELSPSARFFEQVGNGALVEILRSDLTMDSIPASKITYVGYDWAGRAAQLVLNDVTGDRYAYGRISYERADEESEVSYDTVTVENSGGEQVFTTFYMEGLKNGEIGGLAASMDTLGGQSKLAAYMPLQSVKGISRAQFDLDTMTLTTNAMVIPVAEGVECYNKATGNWYPVEDGDSEQALKLALAFSNNLTVYYDRSPDQGGKVRVVVAE
ncbi:S-layer homology domain-containing protein [uncultured Flavonifractor sp.]|uniref:S-layer homology domain-containing protein n=1 Tax=uncultured Flavonifractor sp. TaxID=1193534 RepID=UPI002639A18B|nr:S-layer homology domain-containing protein [uncultured Flavonifractor sp.]